MRRIFLLTVAVFVVVAAPAGAQAIATATPNVAGKGTRLHFDVDATLPPVNGNVPSALFITTPPGFVFNAKAVTKRCNRTEALLNECPTASRIGSGTLVVQVTQPESVRDVVANLRLYVQASGKILAVAFLAGYRVVPGTIDGSNGLQIAFSPLPAPPVFPNVTYALKRLTVDVGASRLVVRGRQQTKGKRKIRVQKSRVYLISNPADCATGTWDSTVTLVYPDGSNNVLSAPTPCAPA
jgi:hypothetical protein